MKIPAELVEHAKQKFFLEGKTVATWAQENNFNRDLVYAVLNGRSKASRGESHEIAVRLGLKPAGLNLEKESTDIQ